MSTSVYQMVTDRIIAELEKGNIPWRKPWTGIRSGAYNRISKKSYSLLNQLMLKHEGEYASYKQWQSIGGKVKKGEKSEIVVFWKMFPIEEKGEDGKPVKKIIPLLRYYNVFHISQVDGVKPLEKPDITEIESIDSADQVIIDYIIREGIMFQNTKPSDQAFYSPTRDAVVVPMKEQYEHINEYYSTTFHELVHSTGHETRLNRMTKGKNAAFGSEIYSKEELVAEIGSACMLNTIGIETPKTFKNSAAYIQSWLHALRDDARLIVSAAGKAEKAVKFILGEDCQDGNNDSNISE